MMISNETKREIIRTARFRKDFKLSKKQGKDMSKAAEVINKLANDEPLEAKHRDHQLHGDQKDFRECHITPDWLLLYKKTDDGELVLTLSRLSSHNNLKF